MAAKYTGTDTTWLPYVKRYVPELIQHGGRTLLLITHSHTLKSRRGISLRSMRHNAELRIHAPWYYDQGGTIPIDSNDKKWVILNARRCALL